MKFAKRYQEILMTENFPEQWMICMVQYKKLKKLINPVVDELVNFGLLSLDIEEETTNSSAELDFINKAVSSLQLEAANQSKEKDIILDYEIEGSLEKFSTYVVVDSSDETRYNSIVSVLASPPPEENVTDADCTELTKTENMHKQIKIRLKNDFKFFQLLSNELLLLWALNDKLQEEINKELKFLSTILGTVINPTRKKNDLYIWREIFQLFVESKIFTESPTSKVCNDIKTIQEKFKNFTEKVETEFKVKKRFNLQQSSDFYVKFIHLNQFIIKLIYFYTINQMAIRKILKKFDKQTKLSAQEHFPHLLTDNINSKQYSALISTRGGAGVLSASSKPVILNVSSISRQVVYQFGAILFDIIPHIDDYTCPVCTYISYKPIRLDCGHVFCIRCLIKLQRMGQDGCPLCRQQVVLRACSENLDDKLAEYLKLYFPLETKEKQDLNESELVKERYQRVFKKSSDCVVS
ncbi:hypothetical protein NADFUDRAFT_69432 [Nadsonia fulvescens var. elongata DSM 6958]|uniref:RING-14 protein n=1 Tax=Nadsonia fulvescens var. elongata DSM 6958 TaxID=857566 RepID=A0A1E3PQZ7_9ASCO|nr:hypothetical protein NADFUDRAFT_69432 [Nadsonia fulvescens var. elongata DSM 6958]